MIARLLVLTVVLGMCFGFVAVAEEAVLAKADAASALHRAVAFFRAEVSAEGGYLWRYSANLKLREGEGKADAKTAWVQPPGTPTVGDAYLAAYEHTGDAYYLDAARETAYALVKGQLVSGGWEYRIYFAPERRQKMAYRVAPSKADGGNVTTLDDNTTQAALRFLMRVDKVLAFEDEAIHEAVRYALGKLLEAQYPNGAWPQRFSGPPDPEKYPVVKASYPETWERSYPAKDYRSYYTFNDNTIADMITMLFEAAETYGEARYRAAAEKAGDFILLAQMPEPQPGWAQQYDAGMHPAWARKFEPPAVTGGESHGVIRTLLGLYREAGEEKYLEPISSALAYYKNCELPDGRLARFYELETNTPLYFTKDYKLTYSSDDMPTHYGFITGGWVDAAQKAYDAAKAAGPAEVKPPATSVPPAMSAQLAARARAAVDALDERGAWVEEGRLKYQDKGDTTSRIIDCRSFVANVRTLSSFMAACP